MNPSAGQLYTQVWSGFDDDFQWSDQCLRGSGWITGRVLVNRSHNCNCKPQKLTQALPESFALGISLFTSMRRVREMVHGYQMNIRDRLSEDQGEQETEELLRHCICMCVYSSLCVCTDQDIYLSCFNFLKSSVHIIYVNLCWTQLYTSRSTNVL